MELDRLFRLGEKLGKSGKELEEWMDMQRKAERDERARLREEEREDRECQLAEREREREVELKHKVQLAKFEAEVSDKKKEVLQLELEVREAGEPSNVGHYDNGSNTQKWSKLPPFDDSKDDLDAYLKRFERWASNQGWDDSVWASRLSILLKGKALEVYSRLSDDDASSYVALREALLHRYQLTEEGFQDKFRTSKLEVGETSAQFIIRLEGYLGKWMDLAGKKPTYEDLKDVVLSEQFLAGCNKELILFLKERKPKTVVDMALLADQYVGARGCTADVIRFTFPGPRKINRFEPTNVTGKLDKVIPGGKQFEGNKLSSTNKCFTCQKVGHIAKFCPTKRETQTTKTHKVGAAVPQEVCESQTLSRCKVCPHDSGSGTPLTLTCGCQMAVMSTSCIQSCNQFSGMPVVQGKLGGQEVRVLRDTGCSGIVVRRALVDNSLMTGEVKQCVLADGSLRSSPVAKIEIESPFYSGVVEALCMESPLYDVIVGNVIGAHSPHCKTVEESSSAKSMVQQGAVVTRAMARTPDAVKPLKTPPVVDLDVSVDDIMKAQQDDKSLNRARTLAKSREVRVTKSGKWQFELRNGLLYRIFTSQKVNHGEPVRQLVVPQNLTSKVMKLAHESILGGHLATKKTVLRILEHFYWPDVWSMVSRYCQCCDICQRTTSKGKTFKVPLGQMPLIEQPFKRVAIDLVGPMFPATERKHKYILTLVDYATRYPEAIALKNIDTETVADALLTIFSRVGLPEEILSDRGTQFTSQLMAEVSKLLSIKQLHTTPYHPSCNGLVEKFNGTLKMMLRKMCSERPQDWDRYIDPLLFAYRNSPQESLGFSPFELLYGRSVRGPLTILRELWTGETSNPEVKSTYQYVIDLQSKLEDTCRLAKENLSKSSRRYKKYYDRKTRRRSFKVGHRVLVLLPTDTNKLLMQWRGPFEVVEQVGPLDFKINMDGKWKTFHTNLLKLYKETVSTEQACILRQIQVAVIPDADNCPDGPIVTSQGEIELVPMKSSGTFKDVHIGKASANQKTGFDCGLKQFTDSLDTIGCLFLFLMISLLISQISHEKESPKQACIEFTSHQLSQKAILHFPDVQKTFILRVDASSTGIGSALLQEWNGDLFPIMYISRKLLDREKSYSVIENECLALVWAIQKFQLYLHGREFVLQTDHAPLLFLNKAKNSNSRIMRWSLLLQPYRFRIEAIKGKRNVGADFLSRS